MIVTEKTFSFLIKLLKKWDRGMTSIPLLPNISTSDSIVMLLTWGGNLSFCVLPYAY